MKTSQASQLQSKLGPFGWENPVAFCNQIVSTILCRQQQKKKKWKAVFQLEVAYSAFLKAASERPPTCKQFLGAVFASGLVLAGVLLLPPPLLLFYSVQLHSTSEGCCRCTVFTENFFTVFFFFSRLKLQDLYIQGWRPTLMGGFLYLFPLPHQHSGLKWFKICCVILPIINKQQIIPQLLIILPPAARVRQELIIGGKH